MKINLNNPQQIIKRAVLLIMTALSAYLLVLIMFVFQSPSTSMEPLQRVASASMLRFAWFGGQQVVQIVETTEQDQELKDANITRYLHLA